MLRCMRPIIVIMTLGLLNLAVAQSDIQRLLTFWQNEQWDQLQNALPAVQQKYPNHPSVLFFSALCDVNGDEAYVKYKSGLSRFSPDLMDDGLLKLAQYHQAKGEYALADQYYLTLVRRFPSGLYADDGRYAHCQCLLAMAKKDSGCLCLQQFIREEKRSSLADWAVLDLETLAGETVDRKQIVIEPPANKSERVESFIQVGAYRVIDNAKQYVKQLHEAGFEAQVVEKKVHESKLFAVWIGNFDTPEAAVAYAKKYVIAFAPEYTIVQKNR
jgi:hypothetical protein